LPLYFGMSKKYRYANQVIAKFNEAIEEN